MPSTQDPSARSIALLRRCHARVHTTRKLTQRFAVDLNFERRRLFSMVTTVLESAERDIKEELTHRGVALSSTRKLSAMAASAWGRICRVRGEQHCLESSLRGVERVCDMHAFAERAAQDVEDRGLLDILERIGQNLADIHADLREHVDASNSRVA